VAQVVDCLPSKYEAEFKLHYCQKEIFFWGIFSSLKINLSWTRGMAQELEFLLCKYEALNSNPKPN
jgi:hypothetical protein